MDLIKNVQGRASWQVFACASLEGLVALIVNRTNDLIAFGLHTLDYLRYAAIFRRVLVIR